MDMAVASPAAIVANSEADRIEREDRGADGKADSDPEVRRLALQLELGELELEPDERARVLRDLLRRRAEALLRVSLGGVHGLSSR